MWEDAVGVGDGRRAFFREVTKDTASPRSIIPLRTASINPPAAETVGNGTGAFINQAIEKR
jgi:hypothetical protein